MIDSEKYINLFQVKKEKRKDKKEIRKNGTLIIVYTSKGGKKSGHQDDR